VSWLRIDDGFTSHRKIAQLTDSEFRCWMRLLCHCAHAKDWVVTDATLGEVAKLTKARVGRFAELGLLDPVEVGYEVHDWILYSDATVGAKVAYYLGEHPEASANEVVRALGAKRELVLSEVRRYHESGSANGSTNGSHGTGDGGSESGSESGSRARAPDPTRKDPRPLPGSTTPRPRGPNGNGPGLPDIEHLTLVASKEMP
jgi:hypothetical protein